MAIMLVAVVVLMMLMFLTSEKPSSASQRKEATGKSKTFPMELTEEQAKVLYELLKKRYNKKEK